MRRAATWYFRLRIPADLAPFLGQFLVRTLRTPDARDARFRAAVLAAAAREWWDMLRLQAMTHVLGKPADEFSLGDLVKGDQRAFVKDAMALDPTLRAAMLARLELQLHQWEGFQRDDAKPVQRMRELVEVFKDGHAKGLREAVRVMANGTTPVGAPEASSLPPPEPAPQVPIKSDPRRKLTLGELAADYLKERGLSEATEVAVRQVARDFHAVVGPKGIGSVTPQDVAEYKKWLINRPGRAGRKQAARATVQRNLNFVRSMLG